MTPIASLPACACALSWIIVDGDEMKSVVIISLHCNNFVDREKEFRNICDIIETHVTPVEDIFWSTTHVSFYTDAVLKMREQASRQGWD